MKSLVKHQPWWLIALWLIGLAVLFKPWVHGTDPVGYYSWLRSAVIDGNLDTTNEYVYFGEDKNNYVFPGPTGANKNPYAIGSAVLWAPFFLLAHLISRVFGLLADGYAPLYVFAASLGSAFYGAFGLWLAYRVARALCGASAARWATIGIWWATPLVFYMYSHPIMSHANDAFVNALFIYTWYYTRPDTTVRGWVLRGAALGLATLVRTQNGLLLILPIAEIIMGWIAQRRIPIRSTLRDMVPFGLAGFVVFMPQLFAWQQTYGAIFPGNPYAVYGDTFNFASPHFFDVLFSTARGLFLWSPLVLFAIIGLAVFATRADRILGLGLLWAWLAQVYLIGSWSQWSGAAAFGQRFMISGTATYVIGLAALLAWLRTRVNWRILGTALAFFIVWNLLLLAQYVVELIPRAGYVDLGQMISGQFRVIGVMSERLSDLLQARFGRTR